MEILVLMQVRDDESRLNWSGPCNKIWKMKLQ